MKGQISAAVFDAYGTLFDVHSAAAKLAPQLGDKADPLSATWRQKQLEYTWLRSLMGRHADFWQVTQDALDFALASVEIADPELRQALLDMYAALEPYPEVKAVLRKLRKQGIKTAILSNGAPEMLNAAVAHAGLTDLLDDVLSVEPMKVYKPAPVVYRIPSVRLGIADENIAFMTANAWDAAGASAGGLRVVWVNRFGQPEEVLPAGPERELHSLDALPKTLGTPT